MINRVQLIGNVGKMPDIRVTGPGKKVASFSLATSETWKDHSGEKQTETQWHNIKVWGNLAEVAENYIRKGQLLYVEGKVTYSSYDDKDGNKRYITEIIASNLQMLGKKGDEGANKEESKAEREVPGTSLSNMGVPNKPINEQISGTGPTSNFSDDLPF